MLNKKIDPYNINDLRVLPEFSVCQNVVRHIIDTTINNSKIKLRSDESEIYLQWFLIEYINTTNTKFQRKIFVNMLNEYFQELKSNRIKYFMPLYNLEYEGDNLMIDDSIQIRKISKHEHQFISNIKSNVLISLAIKRIKYVFVIKIKDGDDNARCAREKAIETINKFLVIKSGDLYLGGLYGFKKKSIEYELIDFEPMNTFSHNKYIINTNLIKKIHCLLSEIGHCYPSHGKTNDYKKKYDDYFDRIIVRFNDALKNKTDSEKIVDLIFALEILLVSHSGEIKTRLSQRAGLFIGYNDEEQIKIWKHVRSLYDFRSSHVHKSKDIKIKIKDSEPITKKYAVKQLENWTRRAIFQMIILTQTPDHKDLPIDHLHQKLDQAMFDMKLNFQFRKLSKKIDYALKQF